MRFQKTLKDTIKFSGIGVHSGNPTSICIKPAPINTGINFIRVDHTSNNLVIANYNKVIDTKLCTVIGNNVNLKLSTIEHLMSALWGVGVDNAFVETDSEEIAIMDGSSAPFVELLEKVGIIDQESPRKYLKVLKEIIIADGDKFVKLLPSDTPSYKCSIDFAHPSIGYQEISFQPNLSNYKKEVSYARTFGFVKEIEALRKMGLARGGSLDNAVGIDDNGILNPEGLRYKDEFVRHKLLDLIGDLFLTGYRLIAKVEGHKCGHYLNNMVLKKLFAATENFTLVELKN